MICRALCCQVRHWPCSELESSVLSSATRDLKSIVLSSESLAL